MTLETWMNKLSPHGLPRLELHQDQRQRRESRSMESPKSPRTAGRLFDANLFRPRHASGLSQKSGSVEEKDKAILPALGILAVEIVGADDLVAADFNGKSDPFVVLELDGQTFRSVTVPHTLSPRWTDQRADMAITDISSILFASVYDQDRFGDPELLGRIAMPVVTLDNNVTTTKVLPLRTKNFAKLTKGTLELKLLKTWDFQQVALSTITPFDRPPEAKDFKAALFLRNVQRVRSILTDILSAAKFLQGCFEWTHPGRSAKAFVAFLVVTYNFELYMTPLFLVAFIFMRPALRELNQRTGLVSGTSVDDFSSFDSTEDNEGITLQGPDDPDADEDKSVAYKIRTGSIFVQNGLGLLASSVESAWTLVDFRVPCMSWLVVGCLVVCALVLYLVPLRWIVLLWGVNKFTKKLRNRNHVSSSEVFNFLNRVPDRLALEKFFDPVGANETKNLLSPDRESKKVGQKKNSFFYNKKFSKKSG